MAEGLGFQKMRVDPSSVTGVSSFVVGVGARSRVIEEVSGIERGVDGLQRDWGLAEVETVREIVSQSGSTSQSRKSAGLFGEFEDARKIVGCMRDIAGFGIGRDDDQRDTEAVLVGIGA